MRAMKNIRLCALAPFFDMELMPKDDAPNSRDLTAGQMRALAAKFARWARECRKTAAAMEEARAKMRLELN